VVLQGEKLRGGFTLIQTGRRSAGPSERKRWLLIKHRDEYADPSWNIEQPGARSLRSHRPQVEGDRRGPSEKSADS
jgi:hypothetical protein